VVELDVPGREEPNPKASSQSKEVVATGVGTDADKALQNAFSQAIEQTVGVLVDAESVVKNDQLIRDEVLTFSRGYVENFAVVSNGRRAACTTPRFGDCRARQASRKAARDEIAVQKLPVNCLAGRWSSTRRTRSKPRKCSGKS